MLRHLEEGQATGLSRFQPTPGDRQQAAQYVVGYPGQPRGQREGDCGIRSAYALPRCFLAIAQLLAITTVPERKIYLLTLQLPHPPSQT